MSGERVIHLALRSGAEPKVVETGKHPAWAEKVVAVRGARGAADARRIYSDSLQAAQLSDEQLDELTEKDPAYVGRLMAARRRVSVVGGKE